jgi:transcriptional regulator with XRE-family HTH domain
MDKEQATFQIAAAQPCDCAHKLGAAIRAIRLDAGIARKEVAGSMDISLSALARLERGKTDSIEMHTLRALAQWAYTHASLGRIFGLD